MNDDMERRVGNILGLMEEAMREVKLLRLLRDKDNNERSEGLKDLSYGDRASLDEYNKGR